jgi:hypothetical protein
MVVGAFAFRTVMRRLLPLLLAACPPPAVPDAGVTLEQFCARTADAECNYLVRCGEYSDGRVCLALYAQQGDCTRQLRSAIDAGRLSYDSVRTGQCLDALLTAPCTGLTTQPACDGALTGLAGIDGGCASDMECIDSAYCRLPRGTCRGVCLPRVEAGQPNSNGAKCVKGTAPYQGLCVPEVPVGQGCTAPDGGFVTLPCAAPATCATRYEDDGGRSTICAVHSDPGMPCSDFDAGRIGCSQFAVCSPSTQICQALLMPGADCSKSVGGRCQLDLWCNTGLDAPVCEKVSDTGGLCLSDESCLDGLCDGGHPSTDGGRPILGACVPRPRLNEPCSAPVCEAGLYCETSQHRCLDLLSDGMSCSLASQCESGQCLTDASDAGVCGVCE